MRTQLQVTNRELFNQTVIRVDLSALSCTDTFNNIPNNFCANGIIAITTYKNGLKVLEGEHGSTDYQEDYGFILTPSEE